MRLPWVLPFLLLRDVASQSSLPNFVITERSGVSASGTDTSFWELRMESGFEGPVEGVTFAATVLDYNTCAALVTDGSLTFTGMTFDEANGVIEVALLMDEEVAKASPLWTDIDSTSATLEYCVRVEVRYNDELVNLARTATSLSISINGGAVQSFSSSASSLQAAAPNSRSSNVLLDYPVNVYVCDQMAQPLDPAPIIYPGTSANICVGLTVPASTASVQGVDYFGYYSDDASLPTYTAIAGGVPENDLALVDCTQQPGGECGCLPCE
jgi:hypothetical protein